ncbi:PREDICTED: pollen-specific leucine-rich repeat extensin-like protein 2 [Branchiostoma belcheri]|uniref:Pollen-specific leucine-rich repeat extensin-like protein 2 n=1 Tax=Branchiostoma belcheri TaxID=7741 RepID=A0A6P5A9P4_BRABE|nr:PREDICTED: pollen-specific leucine-rich repeat extensin-like protein 2 [Branchiostoma belcheri]
MYNSYFKTICDREGVNFLDYTEDFPTNQRKLWSRHDSLHLSEDAGIPRLLQLLEDSCVQLLEAGKQLTPEQWAALEWDKGGLAYVPQLSTRHAGLYKAQIWTKEEGGTANPATGNCKRHKKRVSKKCKAKRKLYQPSWDAFNFKDWREPQTPANPPSQSPVCDPPSQSPVCDPPSQSPVCDPPSQSPVCDPPSQSPVCDPPSQSPVCDPPSQSPVCDPPSHSPVCDPPSQSPVCDPPSLSPSSNILNPPSHSPACNNIPPQTPLSDNPTVGSYMHSMVSRRMCIPVYCHVVVQHTYVCVHCKNERKIE